MDEEARVFAGERARAAAVSVLSGRVGRDGFDDLQNIEGM